MEREITQAWKTWAKGAGSNRPPEPDKYRDQRGLGGLLKTVGNNPMPTAGLRQPHSFHKTKSRPGHRIGKR